ncbi:MAG: hypothetical protein KDA91_03275 [Planctomycetaceae bacterium]|nr:hypothetical protein [Planctomycetaceae bacterium]
MVVFRFVISFILAVDLSLSAYCRAGEIRTHTLRSTNQARETSVRVLLPDQLEESVSYPVVYVLPVEAGTTTRWGDPVQQVLRNDLHNKHGAVCVFPSFADLPWYADHSTNPQLKQEAYLLEDVLPFVESSYPVITMRKGRLLVGFSKSGWGAWSLLLRHPDTFERAAAFDAPLMMDRSGRYGSGPIFGNEENFRAYHVADLLRQRQRTFQSEAPRLMFSGTGNFAGEHQRMKELLDDISFPHVQIPGPTREHSWGSGWLPEAFEWLLPVSSQPVSSQPVSGKPASDEHPASGH